MDAETGRWIGLTFAAFGVVSAVVHYVFKWREVRELRGIRDELSKTRR